MFKPPPPPSQNQLLCRKTFALLLTSRSIQNFSVGKSELESCIHIVLSTQCTRVWFYILVNCCLKQLMFRDFYFTFTFKSNKFITLLREYYPSPNRKTIPFIKTLSYAITVILYIRGQLYVNINKLLINYKSHWNTRMNFRLFWNIL